MDCTDIKALLSGLIDDEVDPATRHEAERHLAGCAACRALVDAAEALDETIAAEAAALAPGELPRGFADAVLARTAFAGDRPRSRFAAWTNGLGWLAAAASIALAATIWLIDQSRSQPVVATEAVRPIVTAVHPASLLVIHPSGVDPTLGDHAMTVDATTGAEPSEAPAVATKPAGAALVAAAPRSRSLGTEPALSREDAETLESVEWLCRMLVNASAGTFADVEMIREVAEYENLIPRLAAARERLSPADRTPLFVGESVLWRIVNGPVSQADVQELRDTVVEMDLARRLYAIRSEGDSARSL